MRLVALLSTLGALTAVPWLHAQEYQPATSDRVSMRVEERAQATGFAWRAANERTGRGEGLDLGLIVEAAYSDNIFRSADDPQSDLTIGVVPAISYHGGHGSGGDRGAWLRAAYLPMAVIYLENSSESRIDHDLSFSAGWRGRAMALSAEGSYRRLGDATADTGTPTDRNEFGGEARLAWIPRERFALEAAAGFRSIRYDQPSLSDSDMHAVELALRYAYSPKTQLALACRAGTYQVTGTGNQDFQRATLRLAWQPRQKISVGLEAGAEHRSFDAGSDTYPVLEARVAWTPREDTEWFLNAYRREEVSAFFPGQNYSLTGVAGGVKQRLGNRWSGLLEAGWERAAYSRVSGSGPADRRDDIWFVRPELAYQLREDLEIRFFYQYSENASTEPGFGYTGQAAGIRCEYQF